MPSRSQTTNKSRLKGPLPLRAPSPCGASFSLQPKVLCAARHARFSPRPYLPPSRPVPARTHALDARLHCARPLAPPDLAKYFGLLLADSAAVVCLLQNNETLSQETPDEGHYKSSSLCMKCHCFCHRFAVVAIQKLCIEEILQRIQALRTIGDRRRCGTPSSGYLISKTKSKSRLHLIGFTFAATSLLSHNH